MDAVRPGDAPAGPPRRGERHVSDSAQTTTWRPCERQPPSATPARAPGLKPARSALPTVQGRRGKPDRRDCACFAGGGGALASGEQEVYADVGEETPRAMKAGPGSFRPSAVARTRAEWKAGLTARRPSRQTSRRRAELRKWRDARLLRFGARDLRMSESGAAARSAASRGAYTSQSLAGIPARRSRLRTARRRCDARDWRRPGESVWCRPIR